MSFPSSAWLGERKPVRRRLSAEAIVAAGLEILAADGLDAVTMRAVAGKLDTGAASLYAHVKDKNELHLLMLDEVIGEVEVPEPADPERWQAQVKEFCRNAYAALTRHPGMASVNIGTIPATFQVSARTRTGATVGRTVESGVPEDQVWFVNDAEHALGVQLDETMTVRVTVVAGTGVGFATVVDYGGDSEFIKAIPAQQQ